MAKKSGVPQIEVDWEQVKKLAAIQCTRDEIASFLGISHDTLQRRSHRDFGVPFKQKLDEWAEGGKCTLRRKQWLLADKNAAMCIFLGKQMLGQRDDIRLNHSGPMVQEIVQYGDNPTGPWKKPDEDKDEDTSV